MNICNCDGYLKWPVTANWVRIQNENSQGFDAKHPVKNNVRHGIRLTYSWMIIALSGIVFFFTPKALPICMFYIKFWCRLFMELWVQQFDFTKAFFTIQGPVRVYIFSIIIVAILTSSRKYFKGFIIL